MSHTHPSAATIERFVMDRLPESELAPFEEHLLVCPKCQDEVAAATQYVTSLKAAAARIESEERPHRRLDFKFPKPLWAATAAALLFVLWFASPHSSQPLQTVALTTMRGQASSPPGAAGAPLQLELDSTGIPPRAAYRIDVVDAAGTVLVTRTAPPQTPRIILRIDPLSAGQYWIRVSSGGTLLREYSLPVQAR